MHLFVYGTLMGGTHTAMSGWLSHWLGPAQPARVPGRLMAIPSAHGWYPALVRDAPGGEVHGFICKVRLHARGWSKLDRYEGGEYRRDSIMVRGSCGWRRAHAYVWIAPIPTGARLIAGGKFLEWLRESGGAMLRR